MKCVEVKEWEERDAGRCVSSGDWVEDAAANTSRWKGWSGCTVSTVDASCFFFNDTATSEIYTG